MSDDDLQALIALLLLDHMSPNRLRGLLSVVAPAAAVDALRAERIPPVDPDVGLRAPSEVRSSWAAGLGEVLASVDLDAYRSGDVAVLTPDDPRWPFADDPHPPAIVFARGDLDLIGRRPAVGVVGTRRCTSVGRRVAHALGVELSSAGVGVVSGLALGVDAAAHRGALDGGGPVIGVVACGLDVVYPASNRDLWEQVATAGLLLSEVPLGQRPTRWRFPARNRLIAALSDVVVVVESHASGGALSTADEAALRGVPVGAVPGSTLSSAADGTNGLLFDGAMPVRNAGDVLATLGIADPAASRAGSATDRVTGVGADLGPDHRLVLEAVAGGAVHLDRIVGLLGCAPPAAGAIVDELVAGGLVELHGHVVEATVLGAASTRG